jgi:uncharacterized protein
VIFLRIAITGATGFIGSYLSGYFSHRGDLILHIVRTKQQDTMIPRSYWDPNVGDIDKQALEGYDVFIHLAGENISARRWSQPQKDRILMSRVKGTRLLCETLAHLTKPPQVLLSASAIGYYGNQSASVALDEQSPKGNDFLAEVTAEWEAASQSAQQAGIRVVHMRLGVVLSGEGGALAKMLPAFRLGMGGKIGQGKQIMSWIALPEIPHIIDFIVQQPSISGPVNLVSPYPVSNEEFTKTLGAVLCRPTPFSIPPSLLRFLLGEMADVLLIHGNQVFPHKLQENKYSFLYPSLSQALSDVLGKGKRVC